MMTPTLRITLGLLAILALSGVPPAWAASREVTPDEAPLEDFAASLEPEIYTYQSTGLRDPFASLLSEDEVDERDGLPTVADLFIVGIVWGARDRMALAETRGGLSLILRVGDALRDGRVLSVTPNGVTIRQDYYGMARRVTLPIVSGEEVKSDER